MTQPVMAAPKHEFFGFHADMTEKQFNANLAKFGKVTTTDDAMMNPAKYFALEEKGVYCFGNIRSPLFGCLFSKGTTSPILRLFANFNRGGKMNRLTILFKRDAALEQAAYTEITGKLNPTAAHPDAFTELTKPAQDTGACGETGEKCKVDRFEWNEGKQRAKALVLSTPAGSEKRGALSMELGTVSESGSFYFSTGD